MARLTAGARLKVKGDTFYLPVSNDGVYLRNNVGSFRMEGETIDRWIEKLFPMFNGAYTLGSLTEGLSEPIKQRVYDIAEVLYEKGFVRDVSQDWPYDLPDAIVERYAGQIGFLDSFSHSGAYRFQAYRKADVAAVGSGTIVVQLVSALLESGLPRLRVLITDELPTNRQRLLELVSYARKSDPEVSLEEIAVEPVSVDEWREALRPFSTIVYVSEKGNMEELRKLHSICRAGGKTLIPAVLLGQAGVAGPLVEPTSEGCWESAFRRIHRKAVEKDPELHRFSSTAGAMLANMVAFELFKSLTGVTDSEPLRNAVYILDLETLEGSRHSFLPHPAVGEGETTPLEWLDAVVPGLTENAEPSNFSTLYSYFQSLTSAQTGVFHTWEEGDLQQLPLSLCRVQAADPLSDAPADLLPEIVCSGLTHEEARREAGLAGLELYVLRWAGKRIAGGGVIGVGVGETDQEAILRGLHCYLAERFALQTFTSPPSADSVLLRRLDDERCRYALQALMTMAGKPAIARGEDSIGFPVAWVCVNGVWHGAVGLNFTEALRRAVEAALMKRQHPSVPLAAHTVEVPSLRLRDGDPLALDVPASEGIQWKLLTHAAETLGKSGNQFLAANLAVEPFLRDGPVAVYGVMLRKGGTR